MPTKQNSGNHEPLPQLIKVYQRAFRALKLATRPPRESERLAACVLEAAASCDDPEPIFSESVRFFRDGLPISSPASPHEAFSLAALLQSIAERFDDTDG